ncbi:MAG: hypothetical protein [Circular genetic element sp.]|nr:MAG: hypothetical protein [Circular genetic element sp.]
MANQPSSTSSNHNQSRQASTKIPSRNKKAPKAKVPKVARKAKVDNKQSAIINKLSKQVYSLQMSKYGKVQQNYHTLRTRLIPTNTAPLCLDLTDFTCARPDGPQSGSGAQVFQHNGSGNPPVSEWSIQPYVDNFYWSRQNKDQPDTGSYLAMNCTYFVEVKGVNSLDNTRVRFDIVSQKPEGILPTGGPAFEANVLPQTLGYMKHLAEPMGSTSNRINPTYFKKYMSKTVFINSAPANISGVHPTTANIMRFSFKLKPNKLCTQNQTNPSVGNLDAQPEVLLGNFGPNQVHPCQPLWLIVSCDDQDALGDAVSVDISRRIVWRDTIGSGLL